MHSFLTVAVVLVVRKKYSKKRKSRKEEEFKHKSKFSSPFSRQKINVNTFS